MKNFCGYFNQGICRSCELLPSEYSDQILRKETLLKDSLAGLGNFILLPTQTSQIQGFRNKAKMTVSGTIENPLIGLTGDREILQCPVHHEKINQVLAELRNFITLCRLQPYSIENRNGELKGLILFYSEESQKMYVRFVLRSKESLDRIKKNAPDLVKEFPFISCVTANIQPIPAAILEGPEEMLLYGHDSILHRLGNLELSLKPRAFVQTNQKVSQKLYATAASWIKDLAPNKFSELYCGQGAFSFFAAPYVKSALGIEINEDAVAMATSLAKSRGENHLTFIASDAALVEQKLKSFSPDVVLVNPPRRGLGEAVSLFKDAPYPYFIYSSCSWQTLAQDLKSLPGYKIEKAQIFDMFPHTNHFETLVLLSRR
jgi:23S rRNA (uracil747-C5)-methyltransferase